MKRTEESEQRALIAWSLYAGNACQELLLLFHVPNGGRRSKSEAGRFKAMGVKPGIPDLFLPVARNGFNGCFIEMKSAKGRLTDAQECVISQLMAQGYMVKICYSADEAINVLCDYLGLPDEYKLPY